MVGLSLVGATPEPGGRPRVHGSGGSFIGGRLRDRGGRPRMRGSGGSFVGSGIGNPRSTEMVLMVTARLIGLTVGRRGTVRGRSGRCAGLP